MYIYKKKITQLDVSTFINALKYNKTVTENLSKIIQSNKYIL